MNDADIKRLVEQIRGSAPASSPSSSPTSKGGDPSRTSRADSDDPTVPLLTEIVPSDAFGSEGRETSVPDPEVRATLAVDPCTRETPARPPVPGGWPSSPAGCTSVPPQDSGRASDEAWVVALEARIVEQVMARLQTSAQPLLGASFDELLAQRLAGLAASLAAELRGALEERLHDELGARVREAVHEAVWDAIDREGLPQRHL